MADIDDLESENRPLAERAPSPPHLAALSEKARDYARCRTAIICGIGRSARRDRA
jgi:hypothetical protein